MTPEGKVTAALHRVLKEYPGAVARKIRYEGRNGAPDWLVKIPGRPAVWLELKAEGLAAKFPSNPHERQQAREHEVLRAAGFAVTVCDSEASIREALK